MSAQVVVVSELSKTFRKPFSGKAVKAVSSISFHVNEGESFGFLGPNGAGKTTTIKMLTGLIHPTGGSAKLLGRDIPSPETMRDIGFLPENPYVYPYLTPREFVTMCAHLSGVPRSEVDGRVERTIARVGMADAGDREVRKLSKGMTQRIGLAAALVHEPKLLILDEPMSGLDPVGRKEVRDLILEEKRLGRTVFFSTHVLADAEMLCDRVCILRQGKVAVEGRLSDLLRDDARHAEVAIEHASVSFVDDLRASGLQPRAAADCIVVDVAGDALTKTVCEKAWSAGATVRAISQKRETLEDLFVREAL
jgi:ABC-2 type transport system ATP-binding protein